MLEGRFEGTNNHVRGSVPYIGHRTRFLLVDILKAIIVNIDMGDHYDADKIVFKKFEHVGYSRQLILMYIFIDQSLFL